MLKSLKDDDPFPKDFWNYNINPVTGYYVAKPDVNSLQTEKKYNKTSQSL